jgi:hypothetical protein
VFLKGDNEALRAKKSRDRESVPGKSFGGLHPAGINQAVAVVVEA